METKGKSRSGKRRGGCSIKTGDRERGAAIIAARRLKSSSNASSSGGTGAGKTYNSENVLVMLKEVTGSTTWQEDFVAQWNESALKYVVVNQEGFEKKADRCFFTGH